jgi:hypothetical protein
MVQIGRSSQANLCFQEWFAGRRLCLCKLTAIDCQYARHFRQPNHELGYSRLSFTCLDDQQPRRSAWNVNVSCVDMEDKMGSARLLIDFGLNTA